MGTVFFYMWISVALNGESYEAVPVRFHTMADCNAAKADYKGVVNKAPICFPATEAMMVEAGLKP
jgi:hypothetical protein